MSELCLLAVSLLTQNKLGEQPPLPPSNEAIALAPQQSAEQDNCLPATAIARVETHQPEFSKPTSASQKGYGFQRPTDSSAVDATQAAPSIRLSRPNQQQTPTRPEAQVNSPSTPSQPRRVTFSEPTDVWLNEPNSRPEPVVSIPEAVEIPVQVALRSPRPHSGSQLYQQRLAALRAGRNHIRLPANSFWERWVNATAQPSYEQWTALLAQEAGAMSRGQGSNRLTVLLGDSLYLWYPPEQLPNDRFWLNQGISGDTTAGVLRRLSAFANTRPDTIHIMVGINDLRRGATDTEVLTNLRQIMRQLRQTHPQAQIFVHSILPTRLAAIPGDRISRINHSLAYIAQQEQVDYLDLVGYFADEEGNLRRDLTTDGLHLNPRGYAMWQWAVRSHQLA